MKHTQTIILSSILLVLCSCGKQKPEAPTSKSFFAAKAESIIPEKPDLSEEAVLTYLKTFDAKVGKTTTIPGDGLTSVKYHTGVSHSGHGMIVNGGRRENSDVPPEKSYYYEFHYDSEGKLSHIVENNKGVRSLSNLFYYDGANPMAKILFVQGKYSYSDLAFYAENEMYLKCRIAPDGRMISGGLLATNL